MVGLEEALELAARGSMGPGVAEEEDEWPLLIPPLPTEADRIVSHAAIPFKRELRARRVPTIQYGIDVFERFVFSALPAVRLVGDRSLVAAIHEQFREEPLVVDRLGYRRPRCRN